MPTLPASHATPTMAAWPARRRWLGTLAGLAGSAWLANAPAQAAVDPTGVPEAKRTKAGRDLLADDGFTQVWSVVDGYEGDMGKDGRRSVNGWKHAGLPWSDKLERERMYFPR